LSPPDNGPRPIPDDLLPWARGALGLDAALPGQLEPVAGDASNRRYFRLRCPRGAVVVMEAPPATENNAAFLAVQQALQSRGVRVPDILAVDMARGYLLLEDLGDRLLLPALSPATAERWYGLAFGILDRLARDTGVGLAAAYDAPLLREELSRLPAWFLERLLGLTLTAQERDLLAAVEELLVDSALAQPQVLVHRDFHSRNLMIQGDGELAVIDFQDAVRGPVTYDLVSLLRDCYIRWPEARVEGWALAYRERLCRAGLLEGVDAPTFLRWFDLMGLQRHLKVLGTFARLYLRDHKPGYLQDLPLVLLYVEQALARRAAEQPALAELERWWRQRVQPRVAQQAWAGAA